MSASHSSDEQLGRSRLGDDDVLGGWERPQPSTPPPAAPEPQRAQPSLLPGRGPSRLPRGTVVTRLTGLVAAVGAGLAIAAFFPHYTIGAPLLGRISLLLADLAWPPTVLVLGLCCAVAALGLAAALLPTARARLLAVGAIGVLAPVTALLVLQPLASVFDSSTSRQLIGLSALDVGGQLAAGGTVVLVLSAAMGVVALLRVTAPPASGSVRGLAPLLTMAVAAILLVPPLSRTVSGILTPVSFAGVLPVLDHPLVATVTVGAVAAVLWLVGYTGWNAGAGANGVLLGVALLTAVELTRTVLLGVTVDGASLRLGNLVAMAGGLLTSLGLLTIVTRRAFAHRTAQKSNPA